MLIDNCTKIPKNQSIDEQHIMLAYMCWHDTINIFTKNVQKKGLSSYHFTSALSKPMSSNELCTSCWSSEAVSFSSEISRTGVDLSSSSTSGFTSAPKISYKHIDGLTHWPLGDVDAIFKMQFSFIFYWLVSSDFLIIMPSDECQGTLLMISQHRFR